jgi:hypothetical protein
MFTKYILILLFLLFSNSFGYENLDKTVKEEKLYPIAKEIYELMCVPISNLPTYSSREELRRSLESGQWCKPMNDKYLDILSVYLWEVKHTSD